MVTLYHYGSTPNGDVASVDIPGELFVEITNDSNDGYNLLMNVREIFPKGAGFGRYSKVVSVDKYKEKRTDRGFKERFRALYPYMRAAHKFNYKFLILES